MIGWCWEGTLLIGSSLLMLAVKFAVDRFQSLQCKLMHICYETSRIYRYNSTIVLVPAEVGGGAA